MALFYPHKQTVLIALICLIVVGAAAYSAYGSSSGGQGAPTVAISSVQADDAAQQPLPTNDDWRKDFLDAPTSSEPSSAEGASAPNDDTATTSTDLLGRDFFAHYVALKQANLLDNADVVNQTSDDIVTSDFDSIQPKSYSLSDLTVTPLSDQATLDAFASGVARAIGTYSAPEGEGVVVQKYISASDPSVLSEIDPAIASYKRMLTMLLALKTPQIAANDELDLVNAVSALEFASEVAALYGHGQCPRPRGSQPARPRPQPAFERARRYQSGLERGGVFAPARPERFQYHAQLTP